MWNIILLLLAAMVIGAAKRRRNNMNRYISGAIDVDLSLGVLGAKSSIGQVTNSVVDTTRVSSVRCTYTLSDFTPGTNQGPIGVYVAHSDYTATEVDDFIKSAGSWDIGDKIAKEKRSRLIRLIGVFDTPLAATASTRLNEGKPITTKLNWLLAEGDSLKFLGFNMGLVPTSGVTIPNLNVFGKANLWQV